MWQPQDGAAADTAAAADALDVDDGAATAAAAAETLRPEASFNEVAGEETATGATVNS